MPDQDPKAIRSETDALLDAVTKALNATGSLRHRDFTIAFQADPTMYETPAMNVCPDGTIKNVTPVQYKKKDGTITKQYVKLSFSTEDVDFRRTHHLEAYPDGTVYMVWGPNPVDRALGDFKLVPDESGSLVPA